MRLKHAALFLSFFLFALLTTARGNSGDQLVVQAVSADPAVSDSAVKELRSMGTAGLDELFVKYDADIERFKKTGEADENWKRIAEAIDTVAMQKDAYASHLYWFTDLDAAKQAATAQNKPILTLRLLGNLNEEFSCANSRLFRAVLYPNADISEYLRENYILHWQSVRPAPRITIDFGDGRKIERTITGNSIHYILNSNGGIIDALPGLYSPKSFFKYLKQGSDINGLVGRMSKDDQEKALMRYRKLSFDEIKAKRDKAVEIAGVKLTETRDGTSAILAAPIAMSKMIIVDEYSVLRVYDDFAKFEAKIDLSDWEKLSKMYSPSPKLDENSTAFVRRQNKTTKLTDDEFSALFSKLDRFISLDTTRNDFLYHLKLYQWLNEGRVESLESFNNRVYSDIFKTPGTDKWLGLYSSDVYTALDGNGIIQ